MHTDGYGLSVTAESGAVVAAIDRFAAEVLSHGKEAACILSAVADEPDCPMAQAQAAALHLFLQTADGRRRAEPFLAAARAAALRGTDRERRFIAALDAWSRGEVADALDLHLGIARDWPTDLLNVKVAQIHQLNLGDRVGMRDLAEAAVAASPDNHFAWGLLAVSLEQVGDLRRAESCGRKAVGMNRDDPWAQHAVAHVLEAEGRLGEGLAWMEALADSWDRCSSFMYTHNWWHLALFHIDRDDAAAALALYDSRVWGVRKTYVQDQVNAVALLARLELHGIDCGDRWADVAAHVRPRIHDHQNGFLDLHFVYALARAGDRDGLAEMLDSLEAFAATAPAFSRPVWRELVLPAARGMAAFACGRPAEAAASLGPLLPRLHLVGGSTAQQDWFEQTHLQALVQAGETDEARARNARRIALRDGIPWQHRLMADLYRRLGLARASRAALRRASLLGQPHHPDGAAGLPA